MSQKMDQMIATIMVMYQYQTNLHVEQLSQMEVVQVIHSFFLLKLYNAIIKLISIGDNNGMWVSENGNNVWVSGNGNGNGYGNGNGNGNGNGYGNGNGNGNGLWVGENGNGNGNGLWVGENGNGNGNGMWVGENGSDGSNDNGYVSETNRVSRRTVVDNGSDSGKTFLLPSEMA